MTKLTARTILRRGLQYAMCALLIGIIGAPSALADIRAIVTSVDGDAKSGQASVQLHSPGALESPLVTDDDASCSVLIDRETVVQFCGRTSMRIVDDKSRDITIVRIDEGSTRTTAAPRGLDNPLEIHTPIAVAVIVGTVITTTVDPLTGDTTFEVEEGSIRVRATESADSSMVTVEAGESVTIRRGQQPERVITSQGRATNAQDCIGRLRVASIKTARKTREAVVMEEITKADILPPPVSLPPTEAKPWPKIPKPAVETPDPCSEPLLCGAPSEVFEMPSPMIRTPGACEGVPGEHCGF